MTEAEIEQEIDDITDRHWAENFEMSKTKKYNLKLAILDAYKAGMEAARKVYSS